jgi:hypothetical protein
MTLLASLFLLQGRDRPLAEDSAVADGRRTRENGPRWEETEKVRTLSGREKGGSDSPLDSRG